MTQPLFFEPQVTFEKVAAEVTMPEDPNAWPQEITQELFKQCPYVSDFEPHIVMDRVDGERGFAFGNVTVSSKTEIQRGAEPDASSAAGIKTVRVPIIIKDRKLQPRPRRHGGLEHSTAHRESAASGHLPSAGFRHHRPRPR